MGSSTFVSAIIDEDQEFVRGLNLGDSAYMILRPNMNSDDGLD